MLRLIPVFISSIFLSLNFGLLLYVNSTFLASFLTPGGVSSVFLAASLVNAVIFFFATRLLNFFGKEKVLLFFMLSASLGAVGLAFSANAVTAVVSFIVYESFLFMVYYCLDIFVEEKTPDKHAGEVRGVYYMLINGGVAAGPLLLSFLVVDDNLRESYLAAVALLAVPLVISFVFLFGAKKTLHRWGHAGLPIKAWWKKRNIRAVSLAKLALETFYGVMVIYTPIYLHGTLGFEWSELGIIFTIMLLPFVVLEWPAGELADRFWGEKEMMSVGFFLMGIALLTMPFIPKAFVIWMLILLLSRIGASLVEITTESYFFKKIDAKDTGILAIFRLLRPVGIIFGAGIGAASLQFFTLEKIFFILAVVVFFGMREALYLRDTL